MRRQRTLRWDSPPVNLIPQIDAYGKTLREAIWELADFFAGMIQMSARANAPWQDQTGNARRGLRAWARKEATRVIIYLSHSVFYGKFLEKGTRLMAPRPIILPTLELHYAGFMRAVRRLVGA